MPVVEVSSTRVARPRRVVDLLAVLKERPFTTLMATRAQNLVELYGVVPTVADDGVAIPFPSKLSVAARGQELGSPMDHNKKA